MPTRVVVVMFILSWPFTIGRADAQSTQPAPAPLTIQPPEKAPAGAQPALTTQPLVTAPPTTRPTNRNAEETLRQMLQPQENAARPLRPVPEAPPAVDVTSGPGAVAPQARAQPLLREGTLLLDRLGRLTRTEDARTFELVLDSDGRGMTDPPMILIPNRRLQQLEDRVQSSYRDLKIRVSGEVMEYRGRNYLLLQRWSVVPDVAQPLQ